MNTSNHQQYYGGNAYANRTDSYAPLRPEGLGLGSIFPGQDSAHDSRLRQQQPQQYPSHHQHHQQNNAYRSADPLRDISALQASLEDQLAAMRLQSSHNSDAQLGYQSYAANQGGYAHQHQYAQQQQYLQMQLQQQFAQQQAAVQQQKIELLRLQALQKQQQQQQQLQYGHQQLYSNGDNSNNNNNSHQQQLAAQQRLLLSQLQGGHGELDMGSLYNTPAASAQEQRQAAQASLQASLRQRQLQRFDPATAAATAAAEHSQPPHAPGEQRRRCTLARAPRPEELARRCDGRRREDAHAAFAPRQLAGVFGQRLAPSDAPVVRHGREHHVDALAHHDAFDRDRRQRLGGLARPLGVRPGGGRPDARDERGGPRGAHDADEQGGAGHHTASAPDADADAAAQAGQRRSLRIAGPGGCQCGCQCGCRCRCRCRCECKCAYVDQRDAADERAQGDPACDPPFCGAAAPRVQGERLVGRRADDQQRRAYAASDPAAAPAQGPAERLCQGQLPGAHEQPAAQGRHVEAVRQSARRELWRQRHELWRAPLECWQQRGRRRCDGCAALIDPTLPDSHYPVRFR
ncbi:hypothetical protein L1887_55246 [Cichorium endivia]|nr:hypothetical protein L1887_55246 [Cichorium endivia]